MIVVSGEPRSGTSLQMQIIQALGFSLIGEQYIHTWNKHLNPGGIYEVEGMYGTPLTQEVLNGEVSHISDVPLVGDIIKVPTMDLLRSDPSLISKVVYCLRDPREIIVSQRSLRNPRGDKKNWKSYLRHMVAFVEKLEPDDLQNILFIDYGDIMWSPVTEVKRVAKFLGVEEIPPKSFKIPNHKHYRSKKHKAKVDSVGRAGIKMYEKLRRYI